MLSVLSIHLIKSAAAEPFFEPLGMPSSQLPIMPRPLPLGPWGIGIYATLPLTCDTVGSSTMPVISPGQTVDWYAFPVAIACERSAASKLSAPGSAYCFSFLVRKSTAVMEALESSWTCQLSLKMLLPKDHRMGSESLLTGLVALPRMT